MCTPTRSKDSAHQVGDLMSDSMAAIQHHQHHHHFYSHPHAELGNNLNNVAQHQHHQHQHQHHHFQSITTTGSNGSLSNESTISSVNSRCCTPCRCSNRLLTGIVITILPIAITSTLICVFMMQKTNLHQYAIYSFVIFCAAFVFPFALFFFTVILNKIYKFYKREIRSNPSNNLGSLASENCDLEPGPVTASNYGMNTSAAYCGGGGVGGPGRAMLSNHGNQSCQIGAGQSANLICYSSQAYHPYYYQVEDGTIVAYAPENSVIIEDSPPSYEMALLCPSVAHQHHHHHQYANAFNARPIQVILPMGSNKEKTESNQTNELVNNQTDDSIEHNHPNIEHVNEEEPNTPDNESNMVDEIDDSPDHESIKSEQSDTKEMESNDTVD